MQIKFTKDFLDQIKADLIAIICLSSGDDKQKAGVILPNDAQKRLDKTVGGHLTQAIQNQSFSAKEGEIFFFQPFGKTQAKIIACVGAGSAKKFTSETFRTIGSAITQASNKVKATSVALALPAGNELQAMVEGLALANYQFDQFRGKNKKPKNTLKTCILHASGDLKKLEGLAQDSLAIVEGVNLARDLTNRPPNDVNPTKLGQVAQGIAKKYKNISCKILSLAQIRAQKMGALLAVAQGSKTPPTFIHLKYSPSLKNAQAKKSRIKVAFVGKGVTFDSGGLNIKTRDMELMKMDMAGAAAVLGVFEALGKLKPDVAVEGFVAATENMPDGNAYRPSDIIMSRAGKTIEILNTDAEGRLALADALDYACDSKPTYTIDMATLTGGAAYALGELVTPILGNDPGLIKKLLEAGKKAGEPSWELPIIKEYKEGLVKGPADIKNSGSGSKASTITGAIFLEEFVRDTKWVHMDIASTAWFEKPLHYITEVGGTGNPVRTLLHFLQDL